MAITVQVGGGSVSVSSGQGNQRNLSKIFDARSIVDLLAVCSPGKANPVVRVVNRRIEV
jgi:hypothetical protein